ncbi:helicase-associated domain-containing protein [Corynebacterium terpenotabidum]|uniref:Helicase XPB/Ssl2 N-terminal domain-containing protein n=1 Tax=Corynebacterium terpenotabidum Y-11 TaxID=1200352 RepID=S4XAN8_9CORY|nr:helicase-associated domain-containing protein [Corynebacterium terpenotabidum]AGP30207.1 hypothetical protein A606_02770 [Corynebacterium terpenotabidum Y-11]
MPDALPSLQFPSYGDWLTAHDDRTLVDLLWRLRAFHDGLLGRAAGSMGPVADVAALRSLDAAALAVLHGLVHAGAARTPVDAEELTTALTTLCDIAGTPADRRPLPAALPGILTTLAGYALVYGPGLRIDHDTAGSVDAADLFPVAVPDHLQNLFAGTTDLPWVLVDGYRCPVATTDLPGVLADLPDRQRRLLDTLATAGGIGHSASLDDPDRPLSRMIGAGLLDRVDAETARLSPRVGAVIADRVTPNPGGDFTTPTPVPTDDRTDGAGVARVIEILRRVTDLLSVLGTSPLRPLNGGGVGVREISRLAKATGASTDEITETLLLCRHADLVATGLPVPAPEIYHAGSDGDVWGVTDRGASYLAAGTDRRWALLLSGWAQSPHAPWAAVATGAHLLESSLDDPRVADLRTLAAALVTTCDGATDPGVQLWRLRPALAARTGVDALAGVLTEAEVLGLRAGGRPTTAAVAAASATDLDELTGALTMVLPAPVQMLIIQADLTVLAPGLLAPADEAMLRRIADQESAGMASVWRISPESLRRAAAAGDTADQVRAFLTGMAPELPQGLEYLIRDTFRSSGVLTAAIASTVLTVEDPAILDAALASLSDTDARTAGLRRIAPTVAVSRTQLSHVVDVLEDAGVHVSVDGDATVTAHGPLLSLVPDPVHTRATRDEVEARLEAAVEGFRRSRQMEDDGVTGGSGTDAHPGDLETTTVRDPRTIMTALRAAYDRGTQVEISYVDADGTAVQEWISVVTMSPVSIVGVTESEGVSLRIQPHRIAWVATPVH